METRDRQLNLVLFAGAMVSWIVLGWVVLTLDPRLDPAIGYIGAAALGIATGLTAVPLFWLGFFSRHRRIAYRGDWLVAFRRGTWVAVLAALFVVMRLQGIFQPPIGLFLVALVLIAESTLSAQR
jgi:hypothetical protein